MKTLTWWDAFRARRWLQDCTSVGTDPYLIGKPTINVDGEMHIGKCFSLASRPVASHLTAGQGAILRIGDHVSIGSGAGIAAFQHVSIGNDTQIGAFVVIMDTNFHGAPGDQSVQHDCQPVQIGNGCRIGSRVTITRGAVIGDGAEILAGSVVSSVIPPGACAAGAKARIIGRAGDLASRWDSAAASLPELLMNSLNLSSPPDLDASRIPIDRWTDASVRDLLDALNARFGVALDRISIDQSRTFAEIAAAVEQALPERSPRP